jgi:hypothetical protein
VAEWTGRSHAWRRHRVARKERGGAGTSREVGKGQHGEERRLGLWQPRFVGCQMTGGFGLWSKLTWGFDPGKREGTLGIPGLQRGP